MKPRTTNAMKTIFSSSTFLAAAILGAGLSPAHVRADGGENRAIFLADAEAEAPAGAPESPRMMLRTITTDDGAAEKKEFRWLGVGADETTDTLAAQLDLKPGEGLVVTYVASNSPAAAAGLRQHDVLVELDGQMLVDPGQLRKLVQMHADGDSVKLTFFRGGKRQTASAKLATKKSDEFAFGGDALQGGLRKLQKNLRDLNGFGGGGAGGGDLNLEIQGAMEQARQAVQMALKQAFEQSADAHVKLEDLERKLGALASGGVTVNKNATVVVKDKGESLRTVVKKDEHGSYIIVADPTKRLTAHDANGKLLFDGAIETSADQDKVPKDVWKEVEPMLEDLKKDLPAGKTSGGGGSSSSSGDGSGGGGSEQN
jgi:hypothetical protein